ncbi:MAG: T9SS type A sorting domain-containing protein, partial [Saprospiraceae bacterium]|nr:T9SS type A sorting domain-containing protein [Saprospiraceae bacterium]
MLYDSIPITPLCGLVVNSKIVQTLQTCGPQQWIVREWTVLDPCTFDSYTSVQTIYVLDSVPPILDCTSDDTLYTNPLSCIVDYVLPRLDTLIEHNCDELDATAQSTFFVDGQIYAPGITVSLDTGIHHIQFIAADLCWNMDTCSYFVTVLDTVGPIALLCPADDSHVSDYIVGLSCTALNDSFGEPMFFADCCGIDTVICILIDSSGSFLDPRVIRQWIAIDSCGLQSDTCTQVLTIMTISRNQSVFDRSSRRELETRADGAMLHNLRMDANHNQDLKIMPNPWRANVIMELLSSTSEAAVMSITNQQGQSILRQQVELKKGVNQLALDPGSISWPAGVYWIRIQSSSEVYAGKMLHTY